VIPVIAEIVAGVDEAGRGPLAGPVVAAAVVLDQTRPIEGLTDSKLLKPERRTELAACIRERAFGWAVASADVAEIDRLNILQATLLAMRRAVLALSCRPDRVLVDGNCLPELDVSAEAIVGGDLTVAAISAASILAKVDRDQMMLRMHERYPQYGFARHKGYYTQAHLDALNRYGPCPEHRRSFAPVREALGLG
jgi:ribonuclease HII